MDIEHLRQKNPQLLEIAHKHGISRIFVFGSVARGESLPESDIDFLVEMESEASLFGVAGFAYESEKLLGVRVDVVPSIVLPHIKDQQFVKNIQSETVAL